MTDQPAPKLIKEARPRQRVSAQQMTASALTDALELLPSRAESKFGINLKVRASETQFRLAPARDPHQPRLWCVAIRRCSPGGMLDTSGPIWIDRPGRSRTDVAEIIESIRVDIGGWLAAPVRRDLCDWLLTAAPAPSVASAAGLPDRSTSQRPR